MPPPIEHREPMKADAVAFGRRLESDTARGLAWMATSPALDYAAADKFRHEAREVGRMGRWLAEVLAPRFPGPDAEETPT